MAFAHGSKAAIFVNGYDVSAYLRSIKTPMKATTAEVTTFGSGGAKAFIPGVQESTVNAEGYFDPAANAEDAIFGPALATSPVIWTTYPQGDAVGNWGYGFSTVESTYDIATSVAEAAVVTIEGVASSGKDRLLDLHIKQSETVGGNSSSFDNGALSTNGGAVYIHNFGGGTVTGAAKVQHSSDNVTFVDLVSQTIGAAQQIPQNSAARVAVAVGTTINRYVRGAWTVGAGTSPAFSIGFERV